MTEIDYHTETTTVVEDEAEVTQTTLYIGVRHKSVNEMAARYGFSNAQKSLLTELLLPANSSLWLAVLYGATVSAGDMVAVAMSQVGKTGERYWDWYYSYDSGPVNWCVIFVSWAANECGYLEKGILPKMANADYYAAWLIDRNQWQNSEYDSPGAYQPKPGDIIFFDWNRNNSDLYEHVEIVERIENGRVYTVGGNSGVLSTEPFAAGSHVTAKSFAVGDARIRGYGVVVR
jgi:hypothetical protein